MQPRDGRIVHGVVPQHVTPPRHGGLWTPRTQHSRIVDGKTPVVVLHAKVLEGGPHQALAQLAHSVKHDAATTKALGQLVDQCAGLPLGKVVEDARRKEDGSRAAIHLVHPDKVVEVAGHVELALARRAQLFARLDDVGHIHVVDATGAIVAGTTRLVEAAAHVDHRGGRMGRQIVVDLPLHVELTHGRLEGTKAPERAVGLLVQAREVVVQTGADLSGARVGVELGEHLGA